MSAWTLTWLVAAVALALLLLAARMQARRGIDRLSLLPWDYAMIFAAILLMVTLAKGAILWRDGWGP